MAKVPNTAGQRPKTFEIDCLVGSIESRDANTDGDHINKEHTRIKVISDAGYKPIRIMFYYPNRTQPREFKKLWKLSIKASMVNITGAIMPGNMFQIRVVLT